ncbi:DNA primase [Methylobacterium sp. 4-46]|uniref:DNA primase n=1 Tax=unclassified Methylobacterium TaxID=2615210 RepID=UPI000152EA55|nr:MULTISPECIES: DNA primase [Methylobacterium]ACA21021.1 DNA primase [Methylobacterium sp. 4-46]WFT80172.1 DNA primase [Methylobacterium nodulans]
MRYPPHLLEEIRARLPASDVVGRKVRLKKAGREWRGLSPFNAEKTPSFYVNDQKQFFHCFSSGKHGDIFTFLQETEGLSFPEAVERLAAEAGVALPAPSRESRDSEERRRGGLEVMELAAAFFEAQLAGRGGARARDYLARRGLSDAVQREFRLGYAPAERYALRDHLAARDVPAELMIELGLIKGGEDVAVPYDHFRDRIIFPIRDLRGRVIAFGGRALAPEAKPKYLNSPETPLFHKGTVLYNHHAARRAAHDTGRVIAVEGYVDVIAMTMGGHPETVAPLGTALTEDQLGLMWRMADEPILCFDGDGAGRRAAYRALDVALPGLAPGKSLRFALLPEGQDPDDLLRAGGAVALDRVLEGARPLVEVLWSRETEMAPVDTPERRAGLAQRLRELVGQIRDETLRRYYRDEIEARLRAFGPAPAGGGRRDAAPAFARRGRGQPERPASPRLTARASPLLARSSLFAGGTSSREALIIGVLVVHPELLAGEAEDLAALDLASADARDLRQALLDHAAEGGPGDAAALNTRLERAGLAAAAGRIAAHVRPGDRWALDPHADPVRLEDALRQAVILHRRAGSLHSELRAAERALAEEETEANFAWLRDVKERLAVVAAAEADVAEVAAL